MIGLYIPKTKNWGTILAKAFVFVLLKQQYVTVQRPAALKNET